MLTTPTSDRSSCTEEGGANLQAPIASFVENDDTRKLEKRAHAIDCLFAKYTPSLRANLKDLPTPPNPYDRTITKRQWEKAVMKLRNEFIRLTEKTKD